MHQLMTIDAVVRLIRSGRTLAITGVESALDQLPIGAWIGGTMPYVKDLLGSAKTDRQVFVTELPNRCQTVLQYHAAADLSALAAQTPAQGYSLAILPVGSPAHQRYAAACGDDPGGFAAPLVAWLASVDPTRVGLQQPLVYVGKTGQKLTDGVAVAHARLPEGQRAADALGALLEPEGVEVLSFTHGGASALDRRAGSAAQAQALMA